MTRPHTITLPNYMFMPILFLAALSVSVVALWWIILTGGSPFTLQTSQIIPTVGAPGETAVVSREICSTRKVMAEYRPWMRRKSDNATFMIQGGMLEIGKGCGPLGVAFKVPDVPDGIYEYSASLKFQNNLVGRDEHETLPPMSFEVKR